MSTTPVSRILKRGPINRKSASVHKCRLLFFTSHTRFYCLFLLHTRTHSLSLSLSLSLFLTHFYKRERQRENYNSESLCRHIIIIDFQPPFLYIQYFLSRSLLTAKKNPFSKVLWSKTEIIDHSKQGWKGSIMKSKQK